MTELGYSGGGGCYYKDRVFIEIAARSLAMTSEAGKLGWCEGALPIWGNGGFFGWHYKANVFILNFCGSKNFTRRSRISLTVGEFHSMKSNFTVIRKIDFAYNKNRSLIA